MQKSSLGDRMKRYEGISNIHLTRRMPLIIRLDGKSFHSYTKGFERPHDPLMLNATISAAQGLIKEIQCAKLIYMQSDEMSVLINDYEKFETQAWFDKNLQKIVSVSASVVTAYFNKYMWANGIKKTAFFDSRAFVIPREEACNALIWRQQDAERNSVSSLAQTHFSHKYLHEKTCDDMKRILREEKGIDWDTLPIYRKRGWCVIKDSSSPNGIIDLEIPRFQENREYIEKHLLQIEQ